MIGIRDDWPDIPDKVKCVGLMEVNCHLMPPYDKRTILDFDFVRREESGQYLYVLYYTRSSDPACVEHKVYIKQKDGEAEVACHGLRQRVT